MAVSVNLLGGLGNYLFQVAAAVAYGLEHKYEVILNKDEAIQVHGNVEKYISNIFRGLNFGSYNIGEVAVYQEPFFHYSDIPKLDNVRLLGYYQSEKYFLKYRKEILELFSIDEESGEYIDDKYSHLLQNKTCSVHVRRGDYLRLPNHHPVCSLEYYDGCIGEIKKERGEDVKFMVFSDDLSWCRTNFTGDEYVFMEGNDDYVDMWIMSLCDDNIIANSSFSWWGAWLNKHKNKIVFAPKKWFGSAIQHNTKDLISPLWRLK